MKKWIIVIVLAIGAYFVASPYLTINRIKSGIEKQDAQKLSENIDFPALRQNMKDQLNAHIMKDVSTELVDNPLGPMVTGFASKLVDGIIDFYVTPAGLASLMEGKEPEITTIKATKHSSSSQKELFRNSTSSFDSLSKFSVWVPNDEGEKIRFVLTRTGLTWKLSNIIVPLDLRDKDVKQDTDNPAGTKNKVAELAVNRAVTVTSTEIGTIHFATPCQEHVEVVSMGYRINLWEKETEDGKGKAVGQMLPGSRAVILEEGADDFKVKSPLDNSVGWINKTQVSRTLFQDINTREPCDS